MLTHPTVDQLVKLGLAGMARAFTELQSNQSAAGLGHAEWLALLLDREAGCVMPSSVNVPPSRTSTGVHHAVSIERCSRG